MTSNDQRPHGTAAPRPDDEAARALRLQAEARLRVDAATEREEDLANPSAEQLALLLHELRVHQVELEMQNEDLRQAQLDLDAARARWFDLYDMAPVGYCTVSEPGLIVHANLTLTTLLGVARGALENRLFSKFIIGEDQTTWYLAHKQLVADGTPQSCDLRMVGADDASWWAHLTITQARDAQGVPELRIVVSDISARKQAEAASAALQAQLQQAQKMESVGRLAGGVAHDYNNMLAVILGYAELALLRANTSPQLRDDLTEIHKAATRSAQITQQLLTFARKQVVRPQVLDVNATVAHSLTMLRRLIGEQVQFIWAPAANLWPVTMDAIQVDQILTNLCLNARDAIGGAGTLAISTANRVVDATQCAVLRETVPDAVPGEYVQLTVSSDRGRGMSRDVLERIFEPFYTTKDVGEGMGLGLASVYGAVRQNGGFIVVASTPGKGATFEVCIPRCAGELPKLLTPQPQDPVARGHETILIVEDEPAVRRMAVRALERQGYTVLEANGPREAIREVRDHGATVALVLTDVQMPEMSGYDLVVALQPAYPHLRHLFMSAHPSVHAVHGRDVEGQPEDARNFIAKPFTLAALTGKVREVLDAE